MNELNGITESSVSEIVTAQEDEYQFPYHYVAQYKEGIFRHVFLDTWSINYVSTIEFLLGKLSLKGRERVVDIGCGDGRFSREMALSACDSTVVGIDYSKRAIDLAKAMNQDIDNLLFRSLDITKNHDLEMFDVAVLMEVFEHIPLEYADCFLSRVRALLRKGGVLYLTVPHINKALEYKHFQHFSVESIENYLQSDFEIVEVIPFERITWSRRLMLRVLSNRFFILDNACLLSIIYRWYKKYLFFCKSEADCQRIFVKAVAK